MINEDLNNTQNDAPFVTFYDMCAVTIFIISLQMVIVWEWVKKKNNNAKCKKVNVQQHKTNMINEYWNKTQNDAPFVTFYDMCAVTSFIMSLQMVIMWKWVKKKQCEVQKK